MAVEEEEEENVEMEVQEEFAIWKLNTTILYDLALSHSLQWPSLTVQWVPCPTQPYSPQPAFEIHKLLFGTHTCEGEPNFLILADAVVPINSSPPVLVVASGVPDVPKIEVTQKIAVDGEVNRARCMPQNHNIIAAKTSSTDVYVFDSVRQLERQQDHGFQPDLILKGHDKEGYGLSWSPFKSGYLLSGSQDGKVCLWDVSNFINNDSVLETFHFYKAHETAVEHVSWHTTDHNRFGSVGDDCMLNIWSLNSENAQQSLKAHTREVNYLSFDPFSDWLLATASSDSTACVFDTRKLTEPVHVLSGHTDEVFQVEWDPNHKGVLASSSADRRLIVWNLDRIGDEQSEGDGDDGPPELLFSHAGHTKKISDFSWDENQPWLISSVAEDNCLQIWKMSENIYGDGEDDDSWVIVNEDLD